MFQTKLLEKIKEHTFYVQYIFSIHTAYAVMWKNDIDQGMPQMTIWSMCMKCWITKAKDTCSLFRIHIAFPLQLWLHERASELGYMYTAC